jgi:hypothetical protein
MAHVERHRRKRPGQPDLLTWRARWRDPAGKEHAKTFRRKLDAERHLVAIESAPAGRARVAGVRRSAAG